MPHAPQRNGASRRLFSRSEFEKHSRNAEIVDTLVFMIAALLLPAWLLGHLFLTWYPAPETSLSTDEAGSNLMNVSDSSDLSDSSDASETDLPDLPKANSTIEDFDRNSTEGMSTEFQSQLASLQTANAALQQENSNLKARAAETPSQNEDSTASNDLQHQLTAATTKLVSTEERLASTETRLQQTEAQVQTLFNDLETTQSKLTAAEQLAAKMASAPPSASSGASSPFTEIPSEDADDKRLAMANAANNEKLALLKQQIGSLNEEMKSTRTNLNSTTEALAMREKELQQTNIVLQDLKSRNSELKSALTAAQQQAQKTELPKEVYRDFVSSKGSVSKMAFIRWEEDQIIVRSFADKKLYRLGLDRFSPADQTYLLERK